MKLRNQSEWLDHSLNIGPQGMTEDPNEQIEDRERLKKDLIPGILDAFYTSK